MRQIRIQHVQKVKTPVEESTVYSFFREREVTINIE